MLAIAFGLPLSVAITFLASRVVGFERDRRHFARPRFTGTQGAELAVNLVVVFVIGLLLGWVMRQSANILAPALLLTAID